MPTPRFAHSRVALIVLLLVFGLVAGNPPALAQPPGDTGACSSADNSNDPCFANVRDILLGDRSLLPVDDLIVSYSHVNAGATPIDNAVVQTNDSQMTTPSGNFYGISGNAPSFAIGVGRMFNLPRDVVVTVTPGVVNVRDQDPAGFVTKGFQLDQTPVQNGLTMADFNGDGFDDFVIAMTNQFGGGFFQYVTAKDVNDLTAGLVEGPGVPGPNITAAGSITSGDVDGDGTPEVIAAYPDSSGGSQGITVAVYRFLPAELKIEPAGSTFINTGQSTDRIVVLAGNFSGATASQDGTGVPDQVAVVYQGDGGVKLTSITVDVDSSRTPAALQPVVKNSATVAGTFAGAAAGRLDWLSTEDQIAVALNGLTTISFFRFTDDGSFTVANIGEDPFDIHSFAGSCSSEAALRGVAIGNYDQLDQNGAIEVPGTLQVAVLYDQHCPAESDGHNTRLGVAIFGVNLNNNRRITLDFKSSVVPAFFDAPDDSLEDYQAALVAGDAQGRSLLLGPPTKATITGHIQPDTILGLPPMHLGWVNALGEESPSVVNVTVFPVTYNAQYNFATSSSEEANKKSSTSFTYGFEESVEDKISYGIPDIDSVSVTLKDSAKQLFQRNVAKTFNTYKGKSFRLDAATVFDDLVAATTERQNIYSYPVIGHCVKDSAAGDSTAAADGTCPSGEHPLVLQFAGPDQITHIEPTEGAGQEWYQPPQQPGQVFSYPGSLAQLEQEQPQFASGGSRLQLLSGANSVWGSQGGSEAVTVNWTQGGGKSVSSGSTSTYSFDQSVSVSGSADIEGLGLSGSATFAANQSFSSGTLNTSTVSFDKSTGITLNIGLGPDATTTNRAYLYEGQSYIFGQSPLQGTIDDTNKPNTLVQANGFITVGYAADPLSVSGIQSGVWWKQTYNLPDIALNHPQRWTQTKPQGTTPEEVAFNCPIGFSSSFTSPQCTPNGKTPSPSNIPVDPFYQMKGLFVTPGTTTGGPQITQVTAGDTVTLRARVYNYSLTNLPSDSTVHVQFYAQPWDNQGGQFTAGPGPHGFAKAVFIGEDVLDPIPAFCGGSSTGTDDPCTEPNAPLNWVYAQVTWNTSSLPSDTATYWKFWVVAFPESSSGGGVPEMIDHGLANVVPAPVNSLADIPIQTYSNNLGFYNQVFAVVPKAAPSPEEASMPKTLQVADVRMEKDGTAVTRMALNDRVQLRAHHHLTGPALDDVLVLFYDGDPAQGGKLFDTEDVPHIPADGDFVTRVPFQGRSCGPHTLFVKVLPMDGTALPDMNTASIDVTMDPLAEVARIQDVVQQLQPGQAHQPKLPDDWQLERQMKRQLLARLWAIQGLFRRGHGNVAANRLNALEHLIDAQRGKHISAALADALDQDINRLLGCLPV